MSIAAMKKESKPNIQKAKGNFDAVMAAFKEANRGGFKFQITKAYEAKKAAAGHERSR